MQTRQSECVTQTIGLSPIESELPIEIQKCIFSFFKKKELQSIARVNKSFSQLSHEEIIRLKNEYKDNIFYSVGNPIHISYPRLFFFDIDLRMKHRNKIPNVEIYESFMEKNIQRIRLFKAEFEALEYSRSLRRGDQLFEDTEVYQPAIFKVIYIGNTHHVDERSEDLVINRGFRSLETGWNERITNVTYFETDRSNVIALEGILKVHLSEIGEFKMHGPVNYSNLDFLNKNKSFFSLKKSCSIS